MVAAHAAGDRFILLDSGPVALDPLLVGSVPGTSIVAAGRSDPEPVASAIALQGITLRPLSLVHPRIASLPDGTLEMVWTRRARGAWLWADGVDAPLHEEAELYQITFGEILAPAALWNVTEPRLSLSPATVTSLASALPGGALHVRQQGSYALSKPLYLTSLS